MHLYMYAITSIFCLLLYITWNHFCQQKNQKATNSLLERPLFILFLFVPIVSIQYYFFFFKAFFYTVLPPLSQLFEKTVTVTIICLFFR